MINGGEHAGNKLAFQEFFVIPTGAASYSEAMAIGCEVFHNLKAVIKTKFGGDATLIGDEGGFAPPCDVESGLAMLMEVRQATVLRHFCVARLCSCVCWCGRERRKEDDAALPLSPRTTGNKARAVRSPHIVNLGNKLRPPMRRAAPCIWPPTLPPFHLL